jgi:Icc-related predicted phosphoesterase
MCRRGDLDELRATAAWIATLPHRHKLVVAGNHDWAFVRSPDEARALISGAGAKYLEDARVAIAGFRFWGSPWTPVFHDWAFMLTPDELTPAWERIPEGLDVLVTHGPPRGIGDDGLGCAALRDRVATVAPRVHVFGHIHQAGGTWREGPTLFANVTTWEGDRPPTVIDLDAR